MNEKYLGLLQQTIIDSMAKDINEKLMETGKELINSTAEEVFKNLPELYEIATETAFGSPTGRTYRYMPKRQKALVMRLVAPDYYPQIKITKSDDGVCAEAWIYLSHEDTKPVAYGKQYLSYVSAQNDGQFTTDSDLHAYIESTARGIALSKAYQEYGIGSWYSYKFDTDDNPDEILSAMTSNDGVNPVKAYDDKELHTGAEQYDTESFTKHVTPSPAQETGKAELSFNIQSAIPETLSKEASTGQKSEIKNTSSMTLEEARAMKAPIGKAASKGLTLGETEAQYPRNILWMYTQNDLSPETKTALSLIALNNSNIISLFKEKGITFSA